jgi:hypothetical protein
MELKPRKHCWKNTRPFNRSFSKTLGSIASVAGIVLACGWHCFAQTVIQGKVSDAATYTAVSFANVYFDGTAIGVVSDGNGEFRFGVRTKGSFNLVVSFVGYEKVKIPVVIAADSILSFDIVLKQETVRLNDVIVHGDTTPTRSRDLREFIRVLTGATKNAASCRLKNPHDVIVRKAKSGRSITAYAKAPVIIENRALGYELYYDLELFYVDESTTRFRGSTFFKELTPVDEKERLQWEQNREKSYRGSIVHLIRSILADRLQEEGWEVKIAYPRFRPSDKYILQRIKEFRELGLNDSVTFYKEMRLQAVNSRLTSRPLHGHEIMDKTDHQLMTFRGNLMIEFKKETDPRYIRGSSLNRFSQSSELEFQTTPHVLYDNGNYSPQKDVLMGGYFAFGERVAEWVPFEYTPVNK